MKLGTRARYSLRMMVEMARLSDGRAPVSSQDMASWTGISRRYLEQLVIPLRNACLLRGRAGRSGGQLLARPAEEISLREIVEASSGPVVMAECVDHPETCSRSETCHCRLLWTVITIRMRRVLDECSLADMVDPEWLRRELDAESRRGAGTRVVRRNVRKSARKNVRKSARENVRKSARENVRKNTRTSNDGEDGERLRRSRSRGRHN